MPLKVSNLVDDANNPLMNSVKGAIDATGVTKVASTTMAAAHKSVAAVADGTVAAVKSTKDMTISGIETACDTLGVTTGFQAVFGMDTSDEALAESFAQVDADKSGKISRDEMKAAILKMYGKSLDDKYVEAMMTAADTNNDGEIDLDEFKTIMRAGPATKKTTTALDYAKQGTDFLATKTVAAGAAGAGFVKGAVTDPVSTATAVAESTKAGVTAVADGTVTAVKATANMTIGGIETAFDTLGVTSGFQTVFGMDTSDEALVERFAQVDADGSGKVSREEMKAAILKMYGKALDDKYIEGMMSAADKDNDGEIDLDEFKTIMRAGKQ